MGSDRKNNQIPSDDARNCVPRSRPSIGRTSGPTRRSTRGKWTPEEDEVLRMAVQRFQGKNWKKIAECFKDRTDVQCLHRWQKVLNPELIKGPWSQEEDEIIVALVKKHGAKKWSTIAQNLPGRIGKQCRERWHNHLNPNINKEAWSQDEELMLIRAHQLYGNKWAELSKFLPGRSDNAIKNHWNSSVKKKLDMYVASGLLSQFEGFPLVIHQNHPVASSSAPQSSEADSFVKMESEEMSECSQISGFANASQSTGTATTHPGEEWRLTEEGMAIVPFEDCFPEFEDSAFTLPEEQSEMGNISEHDLSICLETFSGSENCDVMIPFSIQAPAPLSSCPSFVDMIISVDTPDMAADTESMMDYPEVNGNGSSPYESSTPEVSGHANTLLNNSSVVQIHEPEPSQSCPIQPDASLLPGTHDEFIYSKESKDFVLAQMETKCNSSRPVPPNDLVLTRSEDSLCSPLKGTDSKRDEQGAGALCYEPPRFPSLDVPFFSCDLVQPGNDLHQEFSPFGIRQLMMSSLVPLKLWDSPPKDDTPENVLISAAKTFSSTPSILKKRHRDLISPLSERRIEKKPDRTPKQETLSSLTGAFSRLDVMLDECARKKGPLLPVSPKKGNSEVSYAGKENSLPTSHEIENEDSKSLVISQRDKTPKEFKGVELLNQRSDNKAGIDLRNAVETANDLAGVLVEHNANDLLISSLDQFEIKSGGGISPSPGRTGHQSCWKLDSISKHAILSSSEKSVSCSPCLGSKVAGANMLIASPTEKVESTCKGCVPESSGMCIDTPLRRMMESPSAWKSPWFLKTFVPGPRFDADLTFEDISYFLPGDCSYDAIGLMKELGEQTADTFADAKEVLGDETPATIMKGKCIPISSTEGKKPENSSPDPQNEQKGSYSASKFTVERRALDFNSWGSPEKKTLKSSNASSSSQSSYLLKECR